MSRSARQWWSLCMLTALAACPNEAAQADDAKPDDSAARSADKQKQGRVSGVIVKVERLSKDGTPEPANDSGTSRKRSKHEQLRLTINTAAVWRDWARDQATESPTQSARKDAAQGANSVGAKGEPEAPQTLVTVEVSARAHIETRFRALDDESSKGKKRPDAVSGRRSSSRRRSAKPTRFERGDLKPGLWVEADFSTKTEHRDASTLTVIRPLADERVPDEK